MTHLLANEVTGSEAARLLKEGQQLLCPVCSVLVRTVPQDWTVGMPLHGIQCPNDQNHFMIHYEDADAMNAMRARMRARSMNR